jgi:hypothetical protein
LSGRIRDDARWRQLFDDLRAALRETNALEAQVLDDAVPEEEWTRAWAQYSGLLGRIGHLQQRLLARRIELLE